MNKISDDDAVERAQVVRPLTQINERELMARLAREVDAGGTILEIGALYGGMTAVLALANPLAYVVTVDDFSWHPADDVPTSKALVEANMAKLEITNVHVIEDDSREYGKIWGDQKIDLLWIDGGHSYEYVYADLVNFGACAEVIALHDFGNPAWPSIQQAVRDFLAASPEFMVAEVAGQVAVLRKAR